MNVDLGIWDKLRAVILFLLFLAAVLGVVVWYLPLVRQNEATRREILKKEVEVKRAEEQGRQLESSIRAVRTDPRAVERLAREKLGYVKPGEVRIQFEAPPTNGVSLRSRP
jgi:cell division protein FtsB